MIGPDPQCGRSQDPRSRSAGVRSLERDHVSRWAVDALAWRASGRTTIGKAINGGYDLLEAKSNRYDRISLVPLRRTNARADPGAVHGPRRKGR